MLNKGGATDGFGRQGQFLIGRNGLCRAIFAQLELQRQGLDGIAAPRRQPSEARLEA
jgi:hypothetical protein